MHVAQQCFQREISLVGIIGKSHNISACDEGASSAAEHNATQTLRRKGSVDGILERLCHCFIERVQLVWTIKGYGCNASIGVHI
jgi:hypothetical protein